MSTFNGIIAGKWLRATLCKEIKLMAIEFPRIRIDHFRQQHDQKPPLACFLSHVHSDHLDGLESLRAPFVYCSAATREVRLLILARWTLAKTLLI